jgi:drug/metabolite transporter (DMT)-like permease
LISIIGRGILRKSKKNISFKVFIPLYLIFAAIVAFALSYFLTGSIFVPLGYFPVILGLGVLYTVATYIMFYSLENELAALIGTINSTQALILAFFSAVLFLQFELVKATIAIIIMIVGIVMLSSNDIRKGKFSKYVFLALFANLLWVFMWLIFYGTIPSTVSPMTVYGWIAVFAFLASIPILASEKQKVSYFVSVFKQKRQRNYVLSAGVLSGLGSVLYSYSYVLNGVLTPIIVETEVFIILVMAYFLLKERFKAIQLAGALIVVFAVFVFLLL